MPRSRPLACLAIALSMTAAVASTADPLGNRQCGGGVCLANVDAQFASEPCRNANLVVAWAQGGGAMAIECWRNDAAIAQPIYIFDRRHPGGAAWELTGIRAFAPEALPQLAHVSGDASDALLPACRRPNPPAMAAGELLLTEKVASDNERHPWCYRVLRVATLPVGVAIRADDGQAPKAGPASAEWQELAGRMAALVAHVDAQALARARVTRRRAPLRDTADPTSAPHGFLVAGDVVTVLERGSVLVKVRFVNARGVAIERWIAREDLAP